MTILQNHGTIIMLFYEKGRRKMKFTELEIPFDEAENYLMPANKEKLNKLFYRDSNFDKIKRETTYYLIGEKGSGKTAYSVYFCNNQFDNIVSKRYVISVDDYSKIIQMKKEGKLNYTHYITLWKAILLIKLFATISEGEVAIFGGKSYNKIRKLLETYNFTKITQDSFSPVSFMDNSTFSSELGSEISAPQVAKVNGKTYSSNTKQTSSQSQVFVDRWVKFINDICEDLPSLKLKNHHYLFIDGIDTRPNDISYKEYTECVYPLVRAVYEINADILAHIKDRKKGRLQIVLLTRLDIFARSGLGNPGSKISDNAAFLNWSATMNESCYEDSEIYRLVNNMIKSNNNTTCDLSWNTFFKFQLRRDGQSQDSFAYLSRLTTLKPRDYVRILRITQEQCKRSNIDTPSSKVINSDLFNRAYSTYFTDSIRTALSFYYNEDSIILLFNFIKYIRRCNFTLEQISISLDGYSKKKELVETFGEIESILNLLFDFNMICAVEKGPYFRWKYREVSVANYDYHLPSESLAPGAKFAFHPALEKEFGLYLKH